jgi:hypothetical protein
MCHAAIKDSGPLEAVQKAGYFMACLGPEDSVREVNICLAHHCLSFFSTIAHIYAAGEADASGQNSQ